MRMAHAAAVRTPLPYSGVRCTGCGRSGGHRNPRLISPGTASRRRRSSRPSSSLDTRPQAAKTPPSCSATDEGRLLLVVLAEAIDGRWYVATAREMTDTERRAFRRKGR